VNDGGSDHYDNLMGLCKSCHSRKTAKESNFGR
jgi:5-methylcytosine-specific restriction endonuclease McrA